MITNITPPSTVKAIFPIKGNNAAVTKAALSHGIIAYPETNIILFEGNIKDYYSLTKILIGGVIA